MRSEATKRSNNTHRFAPRFRSHGLARFARSAYVPAAEQRPEEPGEGGDEPGERGSPHVGSDLADADHELHSRDENAVGPVLEEAADPLDEVLAHVRDLGEAPGHREGGLLAEVPVDDEGS